ncbi:flagellar hook capping protein [Desulforamulus reducens MI-1]|uniref:Flagellar hook capping protein n=1 Tax=Desulforamulus reducens (strain ATCC BAA-1160 / DSM 100696 / MI-1) TaxID=349161 RepID=A4J759_DESRM|nr:flagellar hook capping FlgD N-terminal domain-containing protein [Desulforamulus reducens]ABO50912.1 flagellar hook capping protein [Desulforamulus reducens MI-1]
MEVNQTNNSDLYYENRKTKESVKTLDKDAFLQIMIAQLRYQDPSSPMDSSKFIEQMAMFTTLEQMTNLNTNMERLYHLQELNHASSLIGKRVNLIAEEEQVIGEVERVTLGENSVNIWVAGHPYSLDQVISVERGVTDEPEELPEVPDSGDEPPVDDTTEGEPIPDETGGTDQQTETTEPTEPIE